MREEVNVGMVRAKATPLKEISLHSKKETPVSRSS